MLPIGKARIARSTEMEIAGHPIRQVAYFVADIEAEARQHSAVFGSGPFFVARHVKLASSFHRNARQAFDHSSAFGQWGEIMIEFMTQHDDAPSACHDMYPHGSGRYGLHHMTIFVRDIDTAIEQFEHVGIPLAQDSVTEGGTRFAFADATATLGHMIELYEPNEQITGFYSMVRDAASGWDGADLIRELG